MYEFSDYFDKDRRKNGYSSSADELDDYLRIIDMIIESLLEHRGLNKENKLFSRGLVITESELKRYYDMPPGIRDRDICDPALSVAVKEAFDYITDREKHTEKKKSFLVIKGLIRDYDLDRAEIIAVLLAYLHSIDRSYERIFGFLQDDISQKQPTAGLLLTILNRITPVEERTGTNPFPVSDKLKRYFFSSSEEKGLSYSLVLNDSMLKIISGDTKEFFISSDEAYIYEENPDIPAFFEEVSSLTSIRDKGAYFVENEDRDTALHLLHHLAAYEKRKLLVLDLEKLCGISTETRRVILTNAMILMKMGDTLLSLCLNTAIDYREREMALVRRIIKDFSDYRIFVFGSSEEPHELSVMGVPSLCIPAPTAMQRILMWEWFLGNSDIEIADDIKVPDLADCYEISYGKIRDVCTHAVAGAKLIESASLTRDMLLESMMKINHVDFSSLASRISVLYKWEDLTIPDGQAEILHSACDRFRVRNRVAEKLGLKKKNAYGNGVSILLYGPPGTGKTMAAQVVANELSLPLFRVDISRIFSKYIGETEKNLSAIFDAAKGANVILFFDEADALFSKRTQIKDSNDKYSNSETAYLLQKIEEYDGMSILATNYYDNFDSAFIRRITYAVHLENPDENQRYLLWTTILPAETKFDKDMDFQFLANRFELSGSNIKAILYSAAYMAGAEDKPLGMRHIAKAMQYEYKKQGRLVNSGEFGVLLGYLN